MKQFTITITILSLILMSTTTSVESNCPPCYADEPCDACCTYGDNGLCVAHKCWCVNVALEGAPLSELRHRVWDSPNIMPAP
ncbi:hypothetical protein DCAR_0309878 [Daucus carota subsp. sativus]|uniref:Uncharacterized protein n=1 Tax=Daucus carota subsp. sativus TaxID=79200 RepID=A0A165ZFW0_DAUCS|nr:hypothetical protein DCAR_0309878 [Daucus carota subsp. sativus]